MRVVCCVCVVSLCARNDSLIHLLCEYLRSMGKNGLWVHKKTRCSLRYQIRYAARILLQRGKKEYKIGSRLLCYFETGISFFN